LLDRNEAWFIGRRLDDILLGATREKIGLND